eukprot:4886615-Amphidinium_carterae.1
MSNFVMFGNFNSKLSSTASVARLAADTSKRRRNSRTLGKVAEPFKKDSNTRPRNRPPCA